jgi:hypothetical protein
MRSLPAFLSPNLGMLSSRTGNNRRPNFLHLALLVSGTAIPILWFFRNRIIMEHNRLLSSSVRVLPPYGSSLCQLCRSISLTEMRGPNLDCMQPHQPSLLALKESATDGCQLCGFILKALANSRQFDSFTIGDRSLAGHMALDSVSEQYPGRQISLVAWGAGDKGWLDRIRIITTGEIPEVEEVQGSESPGCDPTMHPNYQLALSGSIDLFAFPGENPWSFGTRNNYYHCLSIFY